MNVKKDVLAAITFLVTGLLFYAVRTGGEPDSLLSSGLDCRGADAVLVGEKGARADAPILMDDEVTRDS